MKGIIMLGRFLSITFFYFTSWSDVHANAGGSLLEMMVPMALVFGIFYVLVIRPQQKKIKEHQDRVSTLKKGDEVVVGGGFIGHVDKVDGDDLYVRMAQDVVMRCIKGNVTQVRSGAKASVELLPTKEAKSKAPKKSAATNKTTKK